MAAHRAGTGLSALLVFASAANAAPGKVDICHNAGGGKVVEITVAASAVAAHFALHGDTYPGTWYEDADGDGSGDDATGVKACVGPAGTVDTGGDPDDDDPTAYPGALDVCDGVDNDSDGDFDEDALDGATLLAREGSALMAFDRTSGAATLVSGLSSTEVDVSGINALTSDLGTGAVYGVERISDTLVRVDVCSGDVAVVGALGTTNTCGLSYGPGGGLYGIDSKTDQLLRINPSTGAATVIGSLGFDLKNCGMSYDCATDMLYGVHIDASGDDWIFTIDPSTGAATRVVTLDPGVAWAQAGLEVDELGGVYYVSMETGIYAVDALTGDAVQIASTTPIDNLSWWSGACE